MTQPTFLDITVTAEHVEHGERNNCSKCPGALALIDAYRDKPRNVQMNTETALVVTHLAENHLWVLPDSLREAIELYDSGDSFYMDTYRLTNGKFYDSL